MTVSKDWNDNIHTHIGNIRAVDTEDEQSGMYMVSATSAAAGDLGQPHRGAVTLPGQYLYIGSSRATNRVSPLTMGSGHQ